MNVVELTRTGAVDPFAVEYTVVDVETTGLNPAADRVCEIAALRMRADGTLIEEFSTFVDPERPVTNSEHHGIVDADLHGAPKFADIAGPLADLSRGSVLVAHNIAYDAAFLSEEYGRLGVDSEAPTGLCTLVTARAQLDRPAYTLRGLVNDMTGRWPAMEHAALADVRNTATLLTALLADRTLRLTGLPSGDWPRLPAEGWIKPRIFGLHEGDAGWLSALVDCLPRTDRFEPRSSAATRYEMLLSEALTDNRIVGEEALRLGHLASDAGLTRASATAIHAQLWHGQVTAAGPALAEPQAVRLRKIAAELGQPHLAESLPATSAGLKGWRVLFLGEQTKDLAQWAASHGAAIAKTLTKTVRLVVVEKGSTDPRIGKAELAGIPVQTVEAARKILEASLPEPTAVHTAAPADGQVPSSLDGDPFHGHRRTHELAGDLCRVFTRPVRWVAEQAADPAVPHVTYTGGPNPQLNVDTQTLPPYEQETVRLATERLAAEEGAHISTTLTGAKHKSAGWGAKAALLLAAAVGVAETARWMLRG